jgi:ABC-type sugar transport system ATPase subunit
MADQPILELKNVYSSYGSIKALKGISLKVHSRERSLPSSAPTEPANPPP